MTTPIYTDGTLRKALLRLVNTKLSKWSELFDYNDFPPRIAKKTADWMHTFNPNRISSNTKQKPVKYSVRV